MPCSHLSGQKTTFAFHASRELGTCLLFPNIIHFLQHNTFSNVFSNNIIHFLSFVLVEIQSPLISLTEYIIMSKNFGLDIKGIQ